MVFPATMNLFYPSGHYFLMPAGHLALTNKGRITLFWKKSNQYRKKWLVQK